MTCLLLLAASASLLGCTLSSEGADNRVEALLEFSGKQPMNDQFYDPVFYDDDYDPDEEFKANLDNAVQVQKREQSQPHIQVDEYDDKDLAP